MESIPSFRLTKHFAAEIVTNHKEIQIMSSHFSYTLLWLLLIVLAFAVALWSTNAPLAKAHSTSAGICKSRVQIFGYECEEHTVTTKDGYILSLQRIPCGHNVTKMEGRNKMKIPVLLQHGVLMDGFTWFLNSPGDSLGYMLADNGYDVWVANSRGTAFSRGHVTFSHNDSAYWDWSWDEQVAYDLPAFYDYVHKHSGYQKIHYVGHSLGTLLALASFSMKKLVSMTRSAALICPIAYVNLVKSPLAQGVADTFLAETEYWLGINEFNPTGKHVHMLLQKLCKQPGSNCYDLLTSFTGKNCCVNSSAVSVFLDYEPQPTSTKNIVHLSQMFRRGTITKFNYKNWYQNLQHYGQVDPPAYNLSAIPKDFPLFLSYGGQDFLSDVDDVKHLLVKLASHEKEEMRVQYQAAYAHEDFIIGINARKLVYEPLIAFLKHH